MMIGPANRPEPLQAQVHHHGTNKTLSPTRRRRRQDHNGGEYRCGLAAMRRRVLLIDLDPQGNATMGGRASTNTVWKVGARGPDGRIASWPNASSEPEAGYDVLPSNGDLTAAEVRLFEAPCARSAELALCPGTRPLRLHP